MKLRKGYDQKTIRAGKEAQGIDLEGFPRYFWDDRDTDALREALRFDHESKTRRAVLNLLRSGYVLGRLASDGSETEGDSKLNATANVQPGT